MALFSQTEFKAEEWPQEQAQSIFTQEEWPKSALPAVDDRPTIWLMSASWCGYCQTPKSFIKKMTTEQKRKLPFKLGIWDVDERGWPVQTTIPAFICNGRVVQTGWDNLQGLEKRFLKSHSKTHTKSTGQRLTPSQLRGFASTYTGLPYGVDNGDYWGHLQDNRHGFTSDQLQGLSQAECAKIHAGCHWGYLTPFKIEDK